MVALPESAASEAGPAQGGVCLHCASPTPAGSAFCCAGCENVHALLRDEGLARYYDLRGGAGVLFDTTRFVRALEAGLLQLAGRAG